MCNKYYLRCALGCTPAPRRRSSSAPAASVTAVLVGRRRSSELECLWCDLSLGCRFSPSDGFGDEHAVWTMTAAPAGRHPPSSCQPPHVRGVMLVFSYGQFRLNYVTHDRTCHSVASAPAHRSMHRVFVTYSSPSLHEDNAAVV